MSCYFILTVFSALQKLSLRDWSALASETGKNILAKIMTEMSADERISYIHEKLENVAKNLREGKVPLSDLAITKQLTKNPGDYADKKSLPHVQVRITDPTFNFT